MKKRLHSNCGIAIGPLLFIIAIIAILAAAIAGSSGPFSSNTQKDSAKTAAAAIVQSGQSLKDGWQAVTARGANPSSVITSPSVTTGTNALFSQAGGAITRPSTVFVNSTWGNDWCYNTDASTYGAYFAVMAIADSGNADQICQQINLITTGSTAYSDGSNNGFHFLGAGCTYDDGFTLKTSLQNNTTFSNQDAFCVVGLDQTDGNTYYFFFQFLQH